MLPKVSVIVPVYNRATLIGRCLDSIFATGYDNLETLVVDDGSSDGGLGVVNEYAARHSFGIRILTHAGNKHGGVSASRNLGIREATGDYICFLDSDDVMLPGRFTYAIEILKAYPELDGVYEAAEIFSDQNERICLVAPGDETAFESLAKQEFEPRGLIHTGGILVRRSLFEKSGLFDSQRWVGEDIHLWLRMFAVGRLVPGRMTKPVVRYYKHSGNTSGYDVAQVELDVLASVYKWARRRGIKEKKLRYLSDKYMTLFYYYLSQTRSNRGGIMKEMSLLAKTFARFPRCLKDRQYVANLYRLVNRSPLSFQPYSVPPRQK